MAALSSSGSSPLNKFLSKARSASVIWPSLLKYTAASLMYPIASEYRSVSSIMKASVLMLEGLLFSALSRR